MKKYAAKKIADSIMHKNLKTLSLSLSDNSMGDQGHEHIMKAIGTNTELTTLKITADNNGLTDESIEKFSENVKKLKKLESLTVSFADKFTNAGAKSMADKLRKCPVKNVKMNFSSPKLTKETREELQKASEPNENHGQYTFTS